MTGEDGRTPPPGEPPQGSDYPTIKNLRPQGGLDGGAVDPRDADTLPPRLPEDTRFAPDSRKYVGSYADRLNAPTQPRPKPRKGLGKIIGSLLQKLRKK